MYVILSFMAVMSHLLGPFALYLMTFHVLTSFRFLYFPAVSAKGVVGELEREFREKGRRPCEQSVVRYAESFKAKRQLRRHIPQFSFRNYGEAD